LEITEVGELVFPEIMRKGKIVAWQPQHFPGEIYPTGRIGEKTH
jgi:hypothetical protein